MSDTRRAAKPVVAASAGMKRTRRCAVEMFVLEGGGLSQVHQCGDSPSSDSAGLSRGKVGLKAET